jgi:hypothetical protein
MVGGDLDVEQTQMASTEWAEAIETVSRKIQASFDGCARTFILRAKTTKMFGISPISWARKFVRHRHGTDEGTLRYVVVFTAKNDPIDYRAEIEDSSCRLSGGMFVMVKKKQPNKEPQRVPAAKGPRGPAAAEMGEAELMKLLTQALQSEDAFENADVVGLFSDYLDACEPGAMSDEERDDLASELTGALGDLRVASNGGDRDARDDMLAINELLDAALGDGVLSPVDMILTGKILFDAGWTVPERLKAAVATTLPKGPDGLPPAQMPDVQTLLLDFFDEGEKDSFAIHGLAKSLMAAFPSDVCGLLLSGFASVGKPELNLAVAGFVLDADPEVARGAIAALRGVAVREPVDSLLVERLVQMRPWLPEALRGELDGAIKALRAKASPPQAQRRPELVSGHVSVCDGSGTNSLYVTQRIGAHHRMCCIMIRASGISDVLILPDLPKAQLQAMQHEMMSALPTRKTDAAGLARMLALGLAGNADAASPPPYQLVEIVESLGLPPLHVDHSSPADLIEELLAGLAPEATDAAATAVAHDALPEVGFVADWFEAGEALENLLRPLKGFKKRTAAVETKYLPARRQFWARQCALSALALRGESDQTVWRQLALVGRDIASDLPLDRIALMSRIAATSVYAFEEQE